MEAVFEIDDDEVAAAAWNGIEHDVQMLVDSRMDDLLKEHFDDAVAEAVKSQVKQLLEGEFSLDEQYIANAVRSEVSKLVKGIAQDIVGVFSPVKE